MRNAFFPILLLSILRAQNRYRKGVRLGGATANMFIEPDLTVYHKGAGPRRFSSPRPSIFNG